MGDGKLTLLTGSSSFKFNCKSTLQCYTLCCRTGSINLHPYDILTIRRRLGTSHDDFLVKYTSYYIDKKSCVSFVLKMPCPFLAAEGCGIYDDRPVECRYFPVGEFFFTKPPGDEVRFDVNYFLNENPNCLGLQGNTVWTLEKWKEMQGTNNSNDLIKEWMEIRLLVNNLDEPGQAQLYIAGYDLDRFRRFVVKSGLLKIIHFTEEDADRIRTDDIALMKFGFKYLKHVLNIEKTLKIKQESELQFKDIIREITKF